MVTKVEIMLVVDLIFDRFTIEHKKLFAGDLDWVEVYILLFFSIYFIGFGECWC